MSTGERTPRNDAARAEQRPSSVLELVGSDRAMSTVLSFLGPALPTMEDSGDDGQFSGGRLREALALGRVLPGVCVANPIKVGPAGAALLAADACLGGLVLAEGSSLPLVFDALKPNTGLRKLGIHWGERDAGDSALLCGALAVNVSLVDVDVSGCVLGRPATRAMAAVLSTATGLQKLSLRRCNLQPGDVALLAGGVAANASLRELDLGHNNVGEAGGRALGSAFETNSTLHVLRMDCTGLGDAGGRAIGAALATNTGLFQLDLSRNELGEASGRAMAAALATNTTLRELNLSANWDFRSGGAVALFGGLHSNHTLLELDMASTGLGHASGVALADMVRENSTLRVLDLSHNGLGRAEDGSGSCSWAQVLAALKDNTGLHTLSLDHCRLFADDGQALAEGLEQRRRGLLRKLGFSRNPGIGDNMRGAIIAACLKPGSSVASLGGVLEFAGWGVHSLAEGLRQDNKLEVLDVTYPPPMSDAGGSWPELFAALAVNTRVHALSLRGCDLTAADGRALASALEQRPAGLLRELDVCYNKELGDAACSAIIVACLRPGSALRKLNIDSSGAGLAVTLSLADCLRANHTLKVLVLREMGTESNWSELFGALAVNSGVRTLSLTACGLKQRDVEALAAALQTSRALQNLEVYDDDLGDNCRQIVARGLATNTTVRRLGIHIRSLPLGAAAAHAFRTLLHTNSTLRDLAFNFDKPTILNSLATNAVTRKEALMRDSLATNAAKDALMRAGRAKGCNIAMVGR